MSSRIAMAHACCLLPLCSVANCGASRDRTPSISAGAAAFDASLSAPEAEAGPDANAATVWPPLIDSRAFGEADLSRVTVAAFSETSVSGSDPQVLDLAPDIVPRAWGAWDRSGLAHGDYALAYPKSCQAKGIAFVGGLTASVIFKDQMSPLEFNDEVGRDAAGNPVAHNEIVPGAYRGALASPGFRQRLIHIAEVQIDSGVDGLFFDEVNASYTGAGYAGNEGFDDHDVADFGRLLCARRAADPAARAAFDLAAADKLDCTSADPGGAFDYRGYLARHGAQLAPLGPANPLRQEWGVTVQNRPDPAAGSFVETYPSLVYWREIVVATRTYARTKYGKEILVTANGIFPFVDFQSVGLYDWNKDGAGPRGVDYVPVTGTAPATQYDGKVSFMTVLQSLKARSKRIVEAAGGREVPLLVFLDWPTDSMNRYYGLPVEQRKDYVRLFLAEAYAFGLWFALPLATTTDSNTATALGMVDFFKQMRAFYRGHADLFRGAHDSVASAKVSASGVASHVVTLDDGRTVLHLVNHNYSLGFAPQSLVSVSLPYPKAPSSVTIASPDLPQDRAATCAYSGGSLSIDVGTLKSSALVVVR